MVDQAADPDRAGLEQLIRAPAVPEPLLACEQELHDLDRVEADPVGTKRFLLAHRVTLEATPAENGRTFILRGLPVRWSLNVPDNLFVYEKTQDPDGMDRYTFYGKGWGHGVGFCQVGAYGMAMKGWTAQQILTHYYTGIEIQPMK